MSDEIGAVAEVVESPSVETNQQDDFTPPAGSDESIDWRKHSKEYRDFLKTMGADPNNSKWAKQSYNDHGRMRAIEEIEKRGVDGVRDTYEFLKGLGGREAVQQWQERIADQDALDEAILSANPETWNMLPDELKAALPKLGPSFLAHWEKTGPEGFQAEMDGRGFSYVSRAPITPELVGIERVLMSNSKPEEKLAAIEAHVAKIGEWYQNNKQAADTRKTQAEAENPWKQKYEERVSKDATAENERFWQGSIRPQAAQEENSQFDALFKPYQQRLKLDARGIERLRSDFKRELGGLAKGDKDYMDAMNSYQNGRKLPQAQNVLNTMKAGITKYAENAFKTVLNDRYGFYLKGQVQKAAPAAANGKPVSVNGSGVAPTMVTAKPNAADVNWAAWKKHPEYHYSGIYPLKNGKLVQVAKRS